jgi:hypothetical protein
MIVHLLESQTKRKALSLDFNFVLLYWKSDLLVNDFELVQLYITSCSHLKSRPMSHCECDWLSGLVVARLAQALF